MKAAFRTNSVIRLWSTRLAIGENITLKLLEPLYLEIRFARF